MFYMHAHQGQTLLPIGALQAQDWQKSALSLQNPLQSLRCIVFSF